MHVVVGKLALGKFTPRGTASLFDAIHLQLQDPLAKSCGDAFKYLQFAIDARDSNPKASYNGIKLAEKAIAESTECLRSRDPRQEDQQAYLDTIERQRTALWHLKLGNGELATSALAEGASRALSIYISLYSRRLLSPINPAQIQEYNHPTAKGLTDELIGLHAARLKATFASAYNRCKNLLAGNSRYKSVVFLDDPDSPNYLPPTPKGSL